MRHIVYFDVCCLNRPFDNQTQARIHLESDAVLAVLDNCQNGIWVLIGSEVVDFEVSLMPDSERRKRVAALAALAQDRIRINDEIRLRTVELTKNGFKPYDALHLASAENSSAEVFLTTDDKLLARTPVCSK